jgi:hypothetical protein
MYVCVCVTREPLLQGRLSIVDLLVLTSFYQVILTTQMLFTFYKTSYLNKEVNRTEPSPSVSVPWGNSETLLS